MSKLILERGPEDEQLIAAEARDWQYADRKEVENLARVISERARQERKFPHQSLPSGTGSGQDASHAKLCRRLNDWSMGHGGLTWRGVLLEEVYEALAEDDVQCAEHLIEELTQVAAVALRWIRDIQRRQDE